MDFWIIAVLYPISFQRSKSNKVHCEFDFKWVEKSPKIITYSQLWKIFYQRIFTCRIFEVQGLSKNELFDTHNFTLFDRTTLACTRVCAYNLYFRWGILSFSIAYISIVLLYDLLSLAGFTENFRNQIGKNNKTGRNDV